MRLKTWRACVPFHDYLVTINKTRAETRQDAERILEKDMLRPWLSAWHRKWEKERIIVDEQEWKERSLETVS